MTRNIKQTEFPLNHQITRQSNVMPQSRLSGIFSTALWVIFVSILTFGGLALLRLQEGMELVQINQKKTNISSQIPDVIESIQRLEHRIWKIESQGNATKSTTVQSVQEFSQHMNSTNSEITKLSIKIDELLNTVRSNQDTNTAACQRLQRRVQNLQILVDKFFNSKLSAEPVKDQPFGMACQSDTECKAPLVCGRNHTCIHPDTCKAVLSRMPWANSGFYQITLGASKPQKVFCEMDFDDGGWTLVRRNVEYWFFNDELKGIEKYGTAGDSRSNSRFSVVFKKASFEEFLFATGDKSKWAITPKSSVFAGWRHQQDCIQPALIKQSHLSSSSTFVNWCKRPQIREDPWISAQTHLYNGRNWRNDDNEHSMLYGEHHEVHWRYYLDNKDGCNVFIR
eukprot:gb/GECH01009562.1/.p1 GENE.gb/GECH01009562.1/~~gb/GECH01009562.1/.p1  ORF type:complete len:396 (+),score=19.67 gb/GECH01009562.1/:1-1188(+)